jgi:hypothetical protein
MSVQQILKNGLKYSSNWAFGNKKDQPRQFKGSDFSSRPSGVTFTAWGTFLVANAKVCDYSLLNCESNIRKSDNAQGKIEQRQPLSMLHLILCHHHLIPKLDVHRTIPSMVGTYSPRPRDLHEHHPRRMADLSGLLEPTERAFSFRSIGIVVSDLAIIVRAVRVVSQVEVAHCGELISVVEWKAGVERWT